jgi:hypothetical protein
MSGDPGSYAAERLRGMGAATILPKPYHLARAAQVLRELARQARGSLSRP